MKRGYFHCFTLSEVLIVLGIIGLVSALTIPKIISNYQRTLWSKTLQQAYAKSVSMCSSVLAEESTKSITSTSFYRALSNKNSSELNKQISKYYTKPYISSSINCSDSKFQKSLCRLEGHNGVWIRVSGYDMVMDTSSEGGLVFGIDVDGVNKGPELFTSDLYNFLIDRNCNLVEVTGSDLNYCTPNTNSQHANITPYACFQKVKNNKWKIAD